MKHITTQHSLGNDRVHLELRLPKVLHARLTGQAKRELRSLNSEMVFRLQESLETKKKRRLNGPR